MTKCMNQLPLDFRKKSENVSLIIPEMSSEDTLLSLSRSNETSMQMPTVFWHEFPKFGVLLRNCN